MNWIVKYFQFRKSLVPEIFGKCPTVTLRNWWSTAVCFHITRMRKLLNSCHFWQEKWSDWTIFLCRIPFLGDISLKIKACAGRTVLYLNCSFSISCCVNRPCSKQIELNWVLSHNLILFEWYAIQRKVIISAQLSRDHSCNLVWVLRPVPTKWDFPKDLSEFIQAAIVFGFFF